MRVGAHAPVPVGASSFSSGIRVAVFVEQFFGLVAAHPVFKQLQVRGIFLHSAIGTWCERQKPSTLCPSTSVGAVQPFGVRSTIIGQRGRVATSLLRALPADAI